MATDIFTILSFVIMAVLKCVIWLSTRKESS